MKITQRTTEVYCTLQVEGTHSWPRCPFDEVAYLRDTHRHVFHIKAYKKVTHSDRDVEFIMLKHQLTVWLRSHYVPAFKDLPNNIGDFCVHVFGAKSCEMLAEELINEFDLSRCEVNEDGENGAIVTVEDLHVPHGERKLDVHIEQSVLDAWQHDFLGGTKSDVQEVQQVETIFECEVCGAGPNEPCATQSPCNACDAEVKA